MTMQFVKATKEQGWLRLALCGPAGSGKTYTGLRVACALAKAIGTRVAVIDTENGTASKYSDEFDFDVLLLDKDQSPQAYIDALQAAEAAGYGVVMVDSLSHAWAGKGGALEMADKITDRSASGNYWASWRIVSPLHNKLVYTMVGLKAHLIVTMRVKTSWTTEEVNGKVKPKKIGLAPIEREGVDYEFDVVGDLDTKHILTVSKTRCKVLDSYAAEKPGEEFASILRNWLLSGLPGKPKPVEAGAAVASVGPAKAPPPAAVPPKGAPVPAPAAPVPPPPKKVSLTAEDIGDALAEWQDQFGMKDMLKTRQKFIHPVEAVSLKDVLPAKYGDILKLVATEYELAERPFPPALSAGLRKGGLLS